jgi:hypothetical protein
LRIWNWGESTTWAMTQRPPHQQAAATPTSTRTLPSARAALPTARPALAAPSLSQTTTLLRCASARRLLRRRRNRLRLGTSTSSATECRFTFTPTSPARVSKCCLSARTAPPRDRCATVDSSCHLYPHLNHHPTESKRQVFRCPARQGPVCRSNRVSTSVATAVMSPAPRVRRRSPLRSREAR